MQTWQTWHVPSFALNRACMGRKAARAVTDFHPLCRYQTAICQTYCNKDNAEKSDESQETKCLVAYLYRWLCKPEWDASYWMRHMCKILGAICYCIYVLKVNVGVPSCPGNYLSQIHNLWPDSPLRVKRLFWTFYWNWLLLGTSIRQTRMTFHWVLVLF